AQLAGRADHAVGGVPVGLAGGDVEVAGQRGAGQGDDDVVTDGEVVGAADDAAGGHVRGLLPLAGGVVVLGADVDAAVVDRLAVLVLLGLERQDAADDERAGDGGRDDRLLLQAHAHEVRGEVGGGGALGHGDVLGEPG